MSHGLKSVVSQRGGLEAAIERIVAILKAGHDVAAKLLAEGGSDARPTRCWLEQRLLEMRFGLRVARKEAAQERRLLYVAMTRAKRGASLVLY